MIDGLDFLLEPAETPRDSYRWATVTGVSPLRIQFDADTEPNPVTPTTLVPVTTGDRVWTQLHGRMLVILGRVPRGREPVVMATGKDTKPVGGSWETVSLPAGVFTQPPRVFAQIHDSDGDSMGVIIRVSSSTTTTSFSIHMTDLTGTVATEATFEWVAIQMTP